MMPEELKQYNLPSVRCIFKSDTEQLLVSDLSSAHARIATDASKDRKLIEIYNSGADLHSVTASGLATQNGKDWDATYIKKTTKDSTNPDQTECVLFRQVAKMVFYSSLNWVGWRTFQANVQKDCNISLSEQDSKLAIKAWQTTYADLFNFQKLTHKKASSTIHTFSFFAGDFGEVRGHSNRRIFMPFRVSDFKPDSPAQIKNTDCVSFVWTSCEADIIKLAMGVFLLNCDKHPEWKAKQRNIAHDELDVTCNPDYKLEVATALQSHMRSAMAKFIKLIDPDDMAAQPESLLVNSWVDK
jgi:DNA polymerase I-like protein with 3'-5' exonuclease and polymerase domains